MSEQTLTQTVVVDPDWLVITVEPDVTACITVHNATATTLHFATDHEAQHSAADHCMIYTPTTGSRAAAGAFAWSGSCFMAAGTSMPGGP